jgi:LPXTG-motif cell wall-anchored protein
MRWKLIPLAAAVALLLLAASPADAQSVDYGPPPGPIEITCDRVAVDPPITAIVTHHITVNGVAYERTVVYGATVPGLAVVDISDLTSEVGVEYVITDYATWNIGSGQTPTFTATLLCHEPPPTTTTPTTAPPSPPPTVGGITVTPVSTPASTPTAQSEPEVLAEQVDATLPATGTADVGGLAVVGIALIASGGLVLARAGRGACPDRAAHMR